MDPRPRPGFCLLSTSKHVHKAIKQINTSTDKSILMMIAFIVGQLKNIQPAAAYSLNLMYYVRTINIYSHSVDTTSNTQSVFAHNHFKHNDLLFCTQFNIKTLSKLINYS